MKFILGKKLGMSQMFDEEGNLSSITLVEAGPCYVAQIKNQEKDGYEAVQVGLGEAKRVNKPRKGHFKKIPNTQYSISNLKWLREFKNDNFKTEDFKLGMEIKADIFRVGDTVKVSGISKGKGFAGVVKRHGFKGAATKTHGTKHNVRAPGSIGSSFPEKVFKGKKMAGRMGGERVTTKNLKIAAVDAENNLLAIKGAIPGNRGALIEISG